MALSRLKNNTTTTTTTMRSIQLYAVSLLIPSSFGDSTSSPLERLQTGRIFSAQVPVNTNRQSTPSSVSSAYCFIASQSPMPTSRLNIATTTTTTTTTSPQNVNIRSVLE